MKIITFGTLKGGTGKTITTFSTASILAERGSKVLIIDVDPQANITSNVGIDETVEGFIGVQEIFEDPKFDVNKAIIKSPVKELPTLDIIPSSVFLTSTEMRIVSLAGREFLLKNYIKKNSEIFEQYDYIIIDTNPSMSIVNQNAFVISDGIVLLNDIGMNSLKGAELFIALWGDIQDRLDMKNNIIGFIVNKYDTRTKLSKEFLEHCIQNEELSNILFETVIPLNVKLAESELENKPINIYDKTSKGYEAYNALVDEIIKRL